MGVQILSGDCRDVLKTLPNESVNCIVTSPPYYGLRDYGVDGQIGLEQTPDEYVAEMVGLFRECRRVLRSDGVFWLNLGDSYVSNSTGNPRAGSTLQGGVSNQVEAAKRPGFGLVEKNLIGIPWRVAFALQADGWILRQDIIWSKPNPMPESVRDRCTKAHEYIFLLSKSPTYYFDWQAMQEPANPKNYRGNPTVRETPLGQTVQGKLDRNRGGVSCETRTRRSVWTVTTKPFKEAHFATMAPELARICIMAGCPLGGTVLDPFGGAGTTALVADQLQRSAIIIELNPAYVEIARDRLTNDAGMFGEVAV